MKRLMFVPVACLLLAGCNNQTDNKKSEKKHAEKEGCKVVCPEHSADWVISAKVKEAIMADTDLSARARIMSVSTTDGVVTLGGVVRSQAEADKAIKVAKSIEGVKKVKSMLTIKSKT